MPTKFLLVVVALLAVTVGCARVVVTKNPTECDEGLRFYRPKLYLLVAPGEDDGISIDVKYLPDYSEEYSVRMTPGLNATTSFKPTLADGWNLIGFESETDQNIDDLVKSVAGVVPNMKLMAKPSGRDVKVPIGFYEAVIGQDERGCKSLVGWRYVGFFPIEQGAVATAPDGGSVPLGSASLWKLAWTVDGLVFEPIQ
jgi:hypothetical protein